MSNVKELLGRHRFQHIYNGEERSGKSFLAKNMMRNYVARGMGGGLVYNFGMEDDYPFNPTELFPDGFEQFDIIGYKDFAYDYIKDKDQRNRFKNNPSLFLFRDYKTDKVLHFKDFNRFYWGKFVRLERIRNRTDENLFFNAVYDYISNFLFVMDDCKPIFQYGMKDQHVNLIARKNHTGKKSSIAGKVANGVDIITMYHNADSISKELIDYGSKLVMFKTINKPRLDKKINDPQLKETIISVWEQLNKMPQYSSISIDLVGETKYRLANTTLQL